MAKVTIKRVYEPHVPADGQRVLVDRLWPRGMSKERLKDAIWLKEIGPSTELRQWFGHLDERWPEFRARYKTELTHNPDAVRKLREIISEHGPVTLLYSAHDTEHNQAVVIAEYLQSHH